MKRFRFLLLFALTVIASSALGNPSDPCDDCVQKSTESGGVVTWTARCCRLGLNTCPSGYWTMLTDVGWDCETVDSTEYKGTKCYSNHQDTECENGTAGGGGGTGGGGGSSNGCMFQGGFCPPACSECGGGGGLYS